MNTPKWDSYGEARLLSRHRLLFNYHRPVLRYFIDFFGEVDPSSSVMDIACGEGLFLEILRDLGFDDLRGIDLSKSMVEKSRDKALEVSQMDIYELKNGTYDVILLMELLEHLDEPERALKKVLGILSEDGFIFLTVPICDSLQKRLHRLIYSETRLEQLKSWDETHVQAFTKGEMLNILDGIGFEVTNTTRLSNRVPLIGRVSSSLSEFLQMVNIFGLFGEFLVIVATKP